MKKFLLSTLCATMGLALQAQTAYLECGFTDGIPSTFTLADVDALEPSIDMKNLGFAIGTPWLALSEADGNRAAVSTSWYRKAGTSDDWMITSPFNVESAGAVLRWRAKAGDAEYRDGYSVYISDSAADPASFKALIPVFTTTQEKSSWTEHEVSLADFAGKQVRVAFVNNTRDRSTLWIDDIFAGVPAALRINSSVARVVNREGKIPVSGTLVNVSDTDVKEFTISVRFGDGETVDYHSTKTVPAGGSIPFSFISQTSIERNRTLPYELSVRVGKDVSSVNGKVSCLYRRIVAEEVTGVWCGYCVRGIVAMSRMKELYPDSFLGIAVHGSSETWADPMDYTDYSEYLFSSLGMTGYPHATVNRRKMQTGDPLLIPEYYTQLLDRELTAGLSISVDNIDKDALTADLHTDVYFVDDMQDHQYTLAYVLIENDVHKDAIIGEDGKPQIYNGYEQNNYYAGVTSDMGGFESKPSIVPGSEMVYQDVARGFWGDGFDGLSGSLPTEVKADTPYTHTYTITLPDNVLNYENTEVAALLINNKTGEIINADVTPLRAYFSGIEPVFTTAPELTVCRSTDALTLSCSDTIKAVSLYYIDGSEVCKLTPGLSSVTIDTSGMHGIYILKASTGSAIITKKISL